MWPEGASLIFPILPSEPERADLRPCSQGKLALLLTNDGTAAPLAKPSQDRPLVSVTATLIDSSRCRFEVYSTDSPGSTAEIIEDQRIATAIATISELGSFATVLRKF